MHDAAMDFEDLINYAPLDVVQQIVGSEAGDLLISFDPSRDRPSEWRRMALASTSATEVLRNDSWRRAIFLSIPEGRVLELCDDLELSTEDPYKALVDYQVTANSAAEKTLLAALGLHAEEGAFQSVDSVTEVRPHYGLFEHQFIAATRTRSVLDQDSNRSVLLHMPTGAGKTRTAMHIVCDYLSDSDSAVVLWLSNSAELCSQAASEFEAAWRSLGRTPRRCQRYWGPFKLDLSTVQPGLVVASLAKLNSALKQNHAPILNLREKLSLIVFDEAHQIVAKTYLELVDLLTTPEDRRGLLGLSATPGRSYNDPEEDERLAAVFHRQKVTLPGMQYGDPVTLLIEEGYLARPKFVDIPYDDNGQILAHLKASGSDYSEAVLRAIGLDKARNTLVISRLIDLLKRHRRAICFASSVEQSKLLARCLTGLGYSAFSITGDDDLDHRRRSIDNFKSPGETPMALINYGILTAGFDAPETSAVLVARPTKSLVLYSQMIGRALRGPRAGGNRTAEIVTVIDTSLPGFGSPQDAFFNWEDVWDD